MIERGATRQLVQWDLLVARLVLGEHGVPVIDGHVYLLPATESEPLLTRLKRAHREFTRDVPDAAHCLPSPARSGGASPAELGLERP